MIRELLAGLFGGAQLTVDRASLRDFERQAMAIAEATGRAGADVLREETRLLIEDLIRTTPPFGRIPHLEDIEKQYYIGRAAIRRDVRRVFRPVQTLRAWRKPTSARVKRELQRAVRKGDVVAVGKILKLSPARILATVDAKLHQDARDDKGAVPEENRWYVVLDEGSVKDYEEKIYERIGKAKAGWETAAKAVGVDLPEWISRHTTRGTFRQVMGPEGPSIQLSNDVPYGGDFDELKILEKALERRERSMADRLNRALSETLAQA